MSGTTPGGLPYPTGTDLVRDGDNAIKALAEAIDPRTAGLIKVENQYNTGVVEVRATPYEPTFSFNLPRAANTVLVTYTFALNFVGGDSGESLADFYGKWDGVELFHAVVAPHTVANGDSHRTYSFKGGISNQAAGNHAVLLGLYSGMGLIMHTRFLGFSVEALGN